MKSATRGGHHRRTLSRSCVPQIPNGHQISEGRRLHSVLGVTAWPTLKKGIVFFSTGRNRALKLGPLRLSLLLPVSGQSRHLSRPVASHRPIFTISSAKAPHTGATDTGAVIIEPEEIVGAVEKQKPSLVTWQLGSKELGRTAATN